MAYVTRKEGGKAGRILQGIGQGMQAVGEAGMTIERLRQQREEMFLRKQEFEARREAMALEMQDRSFSLFSAQLTQLTNLSKDAREARLEDPAYMQGLNQFYNKSGQQGNMRLLVEDAISVADAFPEANQEFQSIIGTISSSEVLTQDQAMALKRRTDQILKKYASKGGAEFQAYLFQNGQKIGKLMDDKVLKSSPEDIYGYVRDTQGNLNPIKADQRYGFNPVEGGEFFRGKPILEPRKAEDFRGETGFQKSFGGVTGKSWGEQIEKELPRINDTLTNLDAVSSIIERVETGPFAGMSVPFFLQRMVNEGAQEMEFMLNKEGLKAIMAAAAEIGVRGIDTPEEQKRVLDTLASKNFDKDVFKKAVFSMKAAAKARQINIEEKRAWLESGKESSVGFESSLKGKTAFVSPNGDIRFEEEVPPGYVSLNEMWKQKGMPFDKVKTQEPKVTVEDIDKMTEEELLKFLGEDAGGR